MPASDVSAHRRPDLIRRLARLIGIAVLLAMLMPRDGISQERVRNEDRAVVLLDRQGISEKVRLPDLVLDVPGASVKLIRSPKRSANGAHEWLLFGFFPRLGSPTTDSSRTFDKRGGSSESGDPVIHLRLRYVNEVKVDSNRAVRRFNNKTSGKRPDLRKIGGVPSIQPSSDVTYFEDATGRLAAATFTANGRFSLVDCVWEERCEAYSIWREELDVEYSFSRRAYWYRVKELDAAVQEFISTLNPRTLR